MKLFQLWIPERTKLNVIFKFILDQSPDNRVCLLKRHFILDKIIRKIGCVKTFIIELLFDVLLFEFHVIEKFSKDVQLFLHDLKGLKKRLLIMLHIAVIT